MGRSDDVRKQVSESYARAVRKALERRGARASVREGKDTSTSRAQGRGCCCGKSAVSDALLARMAGYSSEQMAALPPDAVVSSFGCGNPLALAAIRPGDTVLDLGSGAGMDLLLFASWFAYCDRTAESRSRISFRSLYPGGFRPRPSFTRHAYRVRFPRPSTWTDCGRPALATWRSRIGLSIRPSSFRAFWARSIQADVAEPAD